MDVMTPDYSTVLTTLAILNKDSIEDYEEVTQRLLNIFQNVNTQPASPFQFDGLLFNIIHQLEFMLKEQDFSDTAVQELNNHINFLPLIVTLEAESWEDCKAAACKKVEDLLLLRIELQEEAQTFRLRSNLQDLYDGVRYLQPHNNGCNETSYYINGNQCRRVFV